MCAGSHPQSRTGGNEVAIPARAGIVPACLCVRVSIPGKTRPVVAVPSVGVRERGQLQMVFVHDGGSGAGQLITAGAWAGSSHRGPQRAACGRDIVSPVPGDLVDGTRIERLRQEDLGHSLGANRPLVDSFASDSVVYPCQRARWAHSSRDHAAARGGAADCCADGRLFVAFPGGRLAKWSSE